MPARSGTRTRWRSRKRWRLWTRIVLAVPMAWVVFVITHLLVSGRTALWAPVELAPPIVFVAVPVILLALVPLAKPIRWRVAGLLGLAVLLGYGPSGLNLPSLWHAPPPAPDGAISVVSWNTEFWDQDFRAGGYGLEPGFYSYLRGLDADVYLLKEYVHIKVTEPLRAENLYPIDDLDRLHAALPGYHIAINGEQITLSRFPIVRSYGIDLRPWLPERLRQLPPELADYPSYLSETMRTDIDVRGTVMSF